MNDSDSYQVIKISFIYFIRSIVFYCVHTGSLIVPTLLVDLILVDYSSHFGISTLLILYYILVFFILIMQEKNFIKNKIIIGIFF